MRILLVNRYFGGADVPTGRMLSDVARELAGRWHDVIILTSDDMYARDSRAESERYDLRKVRSWPGGRFFNWFLFWLQACIRIPFMPWDRCVIMTDPPFVIITAAISSLFRKPGRQVYWWTMDLYPEALVSKGLMGKRSLANRLLRGINEISLRHVHRVISLGAAQVRRLQTYRAWRSLQNRHVIIPPWDNRPLARIERARNRLINQHDWQDKRIILYAGNLGEAHSFEEAIEAARSLQLRGLTEWVFVFVVRGSKRARLESLSSGLENVVVLDYQPADMTADLIWAADVHLITLCEGWEGIVVPSKLYAVLKAEAPVLFIGPRGADTADEIRRLNAGITLDPGCSPESFIGAMEDLADRPRRSHLSPGTDGPVDVAKYILGHEDESESASSPRMSVEEADLVPRNAV